MKHFFFAWLFAVSGWATPVAFAQSRDVAPPARASTKYVLSLPSTTRERPAHRIAVTIGGSYPAAASLQLHGFLAVAPLSALRLSAGGLWHVQHSEREARQKIQPVVMLGPCIVFDMLRYVPHVFVQAGVALVPAAPVVAFGASVEQFFSLRVSTLATLQGVWQRGFGMRVEAQVGISFAGL